LESEGRNIGRIEALRADEADIPGNFNFGVRFKIRNNAAVNFVKKEAIANCVARIGGIGGIDGERTGPAKKFARERSYRLGDGKMD
jgi:hypothetical protein